MKIQYNAPVILTYTFLSACVLTLGETLGLKPVMYLFMVGGSMDFLQPLDYIRLFTHVIGHGDWNHLIGNFTFILLIGPMLEEKYGAKILLTMMTITAFITGVLNIMFFSYRSIEADSRTF